MGQTATPVGSASGRPWVASKGVGAEGLKVSTTLGSSGGAPGFGDPSFKAPDHPRLPTGKETPSLRPRGGVRSITPMTTIAPSTHSSPRTAFGAPYVKTPAPAHRAAVSASAPRPGRSAPPRDSGDSGKAELGLRGLDFGSNRPGGSSGTSTAIGPFGTVATVSDGVVGAVGSVGRGGAAGSAESAKGPAPTLASLALDGALGGILASPAAKPLTDHSDSRGSHNTQGTSI